MSAVTPRDFHAEAEERLGRALTEGERRIDLAENDRILERAKAALVAEIEKEKRRAIKAIVAGRPHHMLVTPAMARILIGLHEAGKKAARAEIEAAGIELPRSFAIDPKAVLADLVEGLRLHLLGIRRRVEREHTDLTIGRIADSALMIYILDSRIPGAKGAASEVISKAFGSGLGVTFERAAGLFTSWTYSAVMDGATCAVCKAADGSVYDTWEAIQVVLPDGGPNPACYGGGRCRCRPVPGSPEDAALPPKPPPPPERSPLDPLSAPEPLDFNQQDLEYQRGKAFLNRGHKRELTRVDPNIADSMNEAELAKQAVAKGVAAELEGDEAFERFARGLADEGDDVALRKGILTDVKPGEEFSIAGTNGRYKRPLKDRYSDPQTLWVSITEGPSPFGSVGETIPLDLGRAEEYFVKIGKGGKWAGDMPTANYYKFADWGEQTDVLNRVSAMVDTWASTAANNHRWALAMQRAIQEEFDLDPKTAFARFEAIKSTDGIRAWAESLEVYEDHGRALRAFARAQYNFTQKELSDAGITELVLYRGLSTPFDMKKGKAFHGEIDIDMQPASSFSSNYMSAASFAYSNEAEWGLMLGARVPANRILGSAASGYGCLGEYEYVVLASRAAKKDRSWAAFFGKRGGEQVATKPLAAHEFWGRMLESTADDVGGVAGRLDLFDTFTTPDYPGVVFLKSGTVGDLVDAVVAHAPPGHQLKVGGKWLFNKTDAVTKQALPMTKGAAKYLDQFTIGDLVGFKQGASDELYVVKAKGNFASVLEKIDDGSQIPYDNDVLVYLAS